MRLIRLLLISSLLVAAHASAQNSRPDVERFFRAVATNDYVYVGLTLDQSPDYLLGDDGRIGGLALIRAKSHQMLEQLLQSGANMYYPIQSPSSLAQFHIRLPYLDSAIPTLDKYDLAKMLRDGRDQDALELLERAPNLAHAWGDVDGRSMLHEAVRYGRLSVIDALIEVGADIDRNDRHGSPPITATAWSVQVAAYRRLVDHHNVHPTLQAAAACAPIKEFKRVLRDHPDQLSMQGYDRTTPLHYAIQADRPAIVRLLVEAGASLTSIMMDGGTPLERAARLGRTDCFRELLDGGADPLRDITGGHVKSDADTRSVLHDAVGWNSIECVRILLERNPNLVNGVGQYRGVRPIDRASHPAIVKLLLEAGADVHPFQQTDTGKWVWQLSRAVRNGREPVVRLMLEHGAPTEWPSWQQGSLIYTAADTGFANIVSLLLEYGAIPNVVDGSGRTALRLAVQRDDAIIAELLVKASHPGIRDEEGKIDPSRVTTEARSPHVWGMLQRVAESER